MCYNIKVLIEGSVLFSYRRISLLENIKYFLMVVILLVHLEVGVKAVAHCNCSGLGWN